MAEFARKLSVGRTVLSNYETGRRLPNSEVIERIADRSNLSLKYILYGGKGDLTHYPTPKIQAANTSAYGLVFVFYERLRESMNFDTKPQKMLWWGDVSISLIDYSEKVLFSIAERNDDNFEVALKIALDSMKNMTDIEVMDIIRGTTQN